MTKAVLLPLGFIFLLAAAPATFAQTSTTDTAVNEAVLRQANTIVLRQKLVAARTAEARGELISSAKLYQDATTLALQIGSGIDLETAQAVSGLARTRLALARQAQSRQDLVEADKQINQVLKVDPHNPEALALKKQNDQMIEMSRGRVPDAATIEQIPVVHNEKIEAGTLVQDGKLLYEMGKLEDSEAKLKEAIKIDPDNVGAFYYLNLIQQAKFSRATAEHTADTQTRMQQVEKQWVLPKNPNLGISNPFAQTNLIYTGPGRQDIVSKLDRIRLDNVSYDSLPLSEVLRSLSEQAKIRDPEKVGINFLINPNADLSSSVVATTGPGGFGGGFPGEGRAAAVDPATGLPQVSPAATAEQVDVGSIIVKLNLSNVKLSDVLDAIVLVADHPIKYSVQDFAVVFSSKSADAAPLFMRTFKVDANTFFQGLESVNSTTFGASSSSGSGGSSSGGGGGGGGGGGQNTGGAVVPVVDMSPGASQLRNTQNGGGGSQTSSGQGGGGGGAIGNTAGITDRWPIGSTVQNGGVDFLTIKRTTDEMSLAVKNFFSIMGVNLNAPKAVFFNDRLGLLFVKATESDLDTIERAIETLNQIPPQVHIKSRFIEVQQDDSKALGFDWYLGQFGSTVVAQGGTSPSLTVPVSAANPIGAFPGTSTATTIPASTTDQLVTGGLNNSGVPTLGTITGILTNPNFQVAIHALEQRQGVESLAEPEVTTTSGRQTQMRATSLITVIVGVSFQQGQTGTGIGTGTTP